MVGFDVEVGELEGMPPVGLAEVGLAVVGLAEAVVVGVPDGCPGGAPVGVPDGWLVGTPDGAPLDPSLAVGSTVTVRLIRKPSVTLPVTVASSRAASSSPNTLSVARVICPRLATLAL